MELYLIRHGEAEGPEIPDMERALTPAGRDSIRKMAAHVTTHGSIPTHIFVSPLKRAQQTAAIFADKWQVTPETVDWLQPSTPPSTVLSKLAAVETTVALVGHLPNLGLVLSGLVWGLPAREISIPKAGIAFLEANSWEAGKAKMHWLLSPETL